MNSLWPDHFLSDTLRPDHCKDVLEGCYNVPYNNSSCTVIDIGANVGAFARWARIRWPNCTLHCYEPHPDNFKMLQETVGGDHAASKLQSSSASKTPVKDSTAINLHNKAVFEYSGQMPLYFEGLNCGEHTLHAKNPAAPHVIADLVDAKDLPKADVLKIDAEGAEPHILQRLHQCDRLKEFSAIMYEYHNAEHAEWMEKLLRQNGFTFLGEMQDSLHRGVCRFVKNGNAFRKVTSAAGSSLPSTASDSP